MNSLLRSSVRRMSARDPREEHRAATSLELLFDLCFVVAVSGAATFLHHHLAHGDWQHGTVGFLQAFFAVWWGWINFSWFASAFDIDDVPYRITTMVQIAGALVVAAGVFEVERDGATVIIVGYAMMRVAMLTQWIRVAVSEPAHRTTAVRYAVGITAVQVMWIVLLVGVGNPIFSWYFWIGAACELLIPLWAERTSPTPWHPHHIAERYGLFNIIVLGESVAASVVAVRDGLAEEHAPIDLLVLAGSAIVILFAMWWIYFEQPAHHKLTGLLAAASWGFGHYCIFASGAAVGAGIEVIIGSLNGQEHGSHAIAGLALAIPVAVYILSVWLLQYGPRSAPPFVSANFLVIAVLVLASAFTPWPAPLTAALLSVLVLVLIRNCEPNAAGSHAVSA